MYTRTIQLPPALRAIGAKYMCNYAENVRTGPERIADFTPRISLVK